MKQIQATKLFSLSALLFLFVGIGHFLVFVLASNQEGSLTLSLAQTAMKAARPLSITQHSLHDFYLGNHYGVGFLFVSLGLLGLLLAQEFRRRGMQIPKSILLLHAIVSSVSAGIAYLFFPWIPVVCFGVAAVLNLLALLS